MGMGDKSGGGGSAGKTAERIAGELYQSTDPLRKKLIGNYMNFLGVDSGGTTTGGEPITEMKWRRNPDYRGPDSGVERYIRKPVITGYTPVVESGGDSQPWNPADSPIWDAGRPVIEDQYNVAKENIMSSVPKGGALIDQLSDVETGRARALGDLGANTAMDEYNKLFSLATGTPQQTLGSLSSIAGQQAMAAAQEQAGKYGALGDIGMGLGMFLGGK